MEVPAMTVYDTDEDIADRCAPVPGASWLRTPGPPGGDPLGGGRWGAAVAGPHGTADRAVPARSVDAGDGRPRGPVRP
ncbi:hypothetical protein GCM10010129_10340 [Streptomyces fumigatiscleroticus]|nr:hypothetical protein GCM10010129_10340 [Streptomyces fumigatiscleroticus]